MLNIILQNIDRNDLVNSLRILVYTMHQEKPLEDEDVQFIDKLVVKLGLEDKIESVYQIDARFKLQSEYIISKMKGVSSKGLFFILSIASKINEKRNLTKYIKTELYNKLPIDDKTKEELNTLSSDYFDLSVDLFDMIFGIEKGWFSSSSTEDIPLHEKLYLIDEAKIDELPLNEKEAFMKILVYLMFEDGKIDANEHFAIELWLNILSLDISFIETINTHSDISLNTINDIETPWFIRFLVFSFLISQQGDESSYLRLSSFRKLQDTKELKLKEIEVLALKYRETTLKLMNELATHNCTVDSNDSCNFIIECMVDFVHGRDKDIKLYELVELKKNMHSDTVVICIDGFTSEGEEEQFEDWKAGLDMFSNIDLKGYKWPAGNKSKIIDTVKTVAWHGAKQGGIKGGIKGGIVGGIVGGVVGGVVASILPWRDAIGKSEKAAQVLLENIDAIYSAKPDTKIILMGHSLGARVIYNTLIKMKRTESRVHEVYLLGGAASNDNKMGWMNVLSVVEKTVYNFYSINDQVLQGYKAAELNDDPIGLGEIEHYSFSDIELAELHNVDCSDVISGHTEYKDNLPKLLDKVKGMQVTALL